MKTKLKNYRKFVYKLRFSVELEAEFPSTIDTDLLRTRYKKLLKSWDCVTEGSLENGVEFHPRKNNKLYFNKESFAEISEVLHIIRKHKGKVDGAKCGLHIHVDAKKLNSGEIIKILKEMIAKQDFIIRDFKVRKDRLSQYCKKISKKDIKGLDVEILNKFRHGEIDYSENYNTIPILTSKYYMLNLQSLREYGTIEFRMANGVKYLRDIKKNVKYLMEFLINAVERK